MSAGEGFPSRPDLYDAGIERIPEDIVDACLCNRTTSLITQPEFVHVHGESPGAVLSGGVALEKLPDKWSPYRVGDLVLATSLIEVPNRGGHRVEALLQPAVDAFARFFPQVPDEVRGDYGLDVSAEASPARPHIQTLVGKVDVDILVNEFTEDRPILEIAGAAINLVQNDAFALSLFEQP